MYNSSSRKLRHIWELCVNSSRKFVWSLLVFYIWLDRRQGSINWIHVWLVKVLHRTVHQRHTWLLGRGVGALGCKVAGLAGYARNDEDVSARSQHFLNFDEKMSPLVAMVFLHEHGACEVALV